MRSRLILVLPLLCLGACAVGPDYRRPEVALPARFSEAGDEWRATQPGRFEVPADWWRVFGDAELDRLEAQVVVDNQTLKAAEAQYRAARAAVNSAAAARFPTVTGSAAASRSHSTGATTDSVSLLVSASWEIDLWGRVRRSVEAAQARAEASADDLAAARLSTQALLAQTWFQLRAADAQHRLLQRTQAAYARFLALTGDRYAAGVASRLDIAQAETQLGTVRTQLSEIELQRAQLEHALTALLGGKAAPAEARAPLPAVPPAPTLLPSTLLEQRPDLAAAERLAAAANAQIGLAQTAYYPLVDLGATAGGRASALARLFDAPNRLWSLGPSLAMTLFDGGARSAGVEQARAGYDQAVAVYRQTVLTAFQEVQDNLAAARLLERETGEQEQTLAAARRAREIAEDQYRAGTISALNVITAQAQELAAERGAVDIHSRRLAASVQLLKNAGGRTAPPEPAGRTDPGR
ncbi:efflux transporter outer membrane subunit [Thiobacillus sedimenti]|uniref:Efflux transporter outer membrane subunit n=1 Tax=Thiobacillus sedimenti TaxID=3110231 RepID=A0ABZ1CMD6_9PROT|nr:efflux transporter outer membrane subunit [Thiobacillus sp. SCUT-2]WRS40559.1 efflux transporter outer membrane subunit [Thiobacillus sp. SCUT-2]